MKKMLSLLSRVCICVIFVFMVQIIPAEASSYQLGDIDQDGTVDASDALLVLQNSAQLVEFDEYQNIVADVNKDETIDASDALQILKVAAQLDKFTINVDLAVGDEYVIDKIFDVGSYMWIYEVSDESGLSVERTFAEFPDDREDFPEQTYTITAQKAGTYEFLLKFIPVGGDEVKAETLYIFNVK